MAGISEIDLLSSNKILKNRQYTGIQSIKICEEH